MNVVKKHFHWIPVLLWMSVIFYLSHQPADESSELSSSISVLLINALSIILPLNDVNTFHFLVRKAAHFFAYFILGVLVLHAISKSFARAWRSDSIDRDRCRKLNRDKGRKQNGLVGRDISTKQSISTETHTSKGGNVFRDEMSFIRSSNTVRPNNDLTRNGTVRKDLQKPMWRVGGIALIICMLYAISDELHQLFIPGRSAEIRDVFIDSFGATVGIFIYILFICIKNSKLVRIDKDL